MTAASPRKICLAGKNQIAVDALLFLIERGWKDQLMICPNLTDTGTSTWQPSLLRFARALGVEVVSLETAQETEGLIFISLEFDRIIQPAAFKTDRLYNIHFSALPAYKGMYTSALPLLHGAKKSGVTLHEIDEGIDTGPIIAQTVFDLPDGWTARDLYFAYLQHGIALFRKAFARLLETEKPESTPQLAQGSSYYQKSVIDYANLSITFRDTAEGIISQLRAFSFREYQTPVVHELEVGGWEVLAERSRKKPGTILEQGTDELIIATIDYDLQLTRMRAWDWFKVTTEIPIKGMDLKYINIANPKGWTPLIRAAYCGDGELCRLLLEAGASPNHANTNGTTPLMYAFSGKDPENVAKTLLNFGADPKQKDLFGNEVRHYHPLFARKYDL